MLTSAKKGDMSEWPMEADCKSVRVAYVGSNPTVPILIRII